MLPEIKEILAAGKCQKEVTEWVYNVYKQPQERDRLIKIVIKLEKILNFWL